MVFYPQMSQIVADYFLGWVFWWFWGGWWFEGWFGGGRFFCRRIRLIRPIRPLICPIRLIIFYSQFRLGLLWW
ncbi:MAG: hypothetical protein GX945_01500 [Lentisphaerae bacterium]|jgi:hypothetical protein|nr:hypothetical protein [Lentisphaerota bacterium]